MTGVDAGRPVTAAPAAPPRTAGLRRRHVVAVVACHFTAASAALGLPPYLPGLLAELGDPAARWAGVLYVVPTAATALSAPLWGRLADRYGRRRLLLRAQLGLAVAFLAASRVESVPGLAAALTAQGLLGGTFAATGAYLAAGLTGPRLARALTAAQASARAALVIAPVTAGALAARLDLRELYAWSALGPLAAALLTLTLPEPDRIVAATGPSTEVDAGTVRPPAPRGGPVPGVRLLCVAEAGFVLATVVTFPYLLPVVDLAWPAAGPALAGALFALPHLCYLVAAPLALRLSRPYVLLATGFGLVAAGAAAHPAAVIGAAAHPTAIAGGAAHWATVVGGAPAVLLTGRLLLGAGLTCGLVALAQLTSRAAAVHPPGRLFGTVETWSKLGAVAAGLAASGLAGAAGPAAPALLGAAVGVCCVPYVLRSSR